MRFFISPVLAVAAASLSVVLGAAPTDEYRDADQLQSGYLPTHNMDPNVVSSAGFGQLWQVLTGGSDTSPGDGSGKEQFMAKPLVYTPLSGSYGGRQLVIAASETNWIYVIDAINGTIYNCRQLHRPFLSSDLACNDLNPQIGITGTPVIDQDTDVMYVYAKTYLGTANGYQNGVYYFHAIDINTLSDIYPPVNINGGPASNDPNNGIYFTGGVQLQRTSLSLISGAVWAGFGGHCDLFNYTGWVVGIDAPTGTVVSRFATEVGSFAPPQDGTTNYQAGGGGSGIWQSGMSLTSDYSNRLFFVTGNDNAHSNIEQPASGRAYMGTLGQAVVNLAVDPKTRQLSLIDYFEPYEYISMDGGDRDLGSSGITGLDPTVFKGTNVAHMGVTVGKNGKAYILNLDNLGGYKNGPNGGDLVIQTLAMPGGGPIFGGVGSYPLEGGYIYMTPIGYATQVYKFIPDANGKPSFTLVSQTPDVSSGRVGVGVPTITTNGGAPGTAILWVTDVDAGLRAYYAVPRPDGSMMPINMPPTPSINKYQRPAFGNGRLYLSTVDGHIICLGSPVAQPFTCSMPINFGSVIIGDSSTLTINCTANIPITKILGLTSTNSFFIASNSSLPSGSLSSGQAFSFAATFNLTTASVYDTKNTSFSTVKPGVASGAITLYTVNGLGGHATSQPLAVSGTTVSKNGFLSISPGEVDFGGLVINSTAAQAGKPGSMIISNIGVANLTITGSAWADLNMDDTLTYVNITQIGSTGQYIVGPGFSASDWPQLGYVIAGGSSISVSLNFRGDGIGTYGSQVTLWSTGGSSQAVILSGVMSNAPAAVLTVNNGEGGAWQPSVTGTTKDPYDGSTITQVGVNFGNLYPGNSTIYILRINNTGGSALLITKSKPPVGVELTSTNPTGDLPEGAQIAPNSYADGSVLFAPSLALSPPNSDPRQLNGTWTLNNNDLNFGVHVVTYTGTVIVPQHGPLDAAGHSIYKYLGCFQDSANGGPRLLPLLVENGANNENGLCQNQASGAGAVFAATEYHTQCWYGNTIPNMTYFYPESANRCTWTCPADGTQPCGGDGGYMNIFYDSTKYNPITGVCASCSSINTPAGGGTTYASIEKKVGFYNYIGCYTEATNGRALQGAAFAYNSMTPDICAGNCTGYSYFGVEYGSECYCGNSLAAGSAVAPNGDSECSLPCAGNSTVLCGAGGRLTLYRLNGTVPSSSSAFSTTPTSASSSSTSSSGSSVSTSPTATTIPTGPAIKSMISPYSYYGCQTEATQGRALSGAAFTYDTMTLESCMVNCTGFSIFGVEYGRECYCGNSLGTGSVPAPASDCNFLCPGDGTEYCGAGNRLSVYKKNSTVIISSSSKIFSSTLTSTSTAGTSTGTPPSNSPTPAATPTIKQAVGLYSYYGCRTEATNSRALAGAAYANDSMTVNMCVAYCSGFLYAGVEYGRECYCGNSFQAGSLDAPGGDLDCSFTCPGDRTELCGAGDRLSVYIFNSTLTSSSSSSPSSSSTTSTTSRATTISTSSLLSTSSMSSTSSTPSTIFTSTISSFSIEISSSSSSSSVSTTTSSSATSSVTGPIHVQSISNYAWAGCFTEATNSRALNSVSLVNYTTMTVDMCANFCGPSYSMFGLEFSGECYCGSVLQSGSVLASVADCSMTCDGNSLEYCGGRNRLDLYQVSGSGSLSSSSTYFSPTSSSTSSSMSASSSSSTPSIFSSSSSSSGIPSSATTTSTTLKTQSMTSPSSSNTSSSSLTTSSSSSSSSKSTASSSSSASSASPTSSNMPTYTGPPVISQGNANFSYFGCLGEPPQGRALPQLIESNATSMTVKRCLGECYQYKYAGLEYGQECWCANSISTGTTYNATGCKSVCAGNHSEYCGGGVRLNVYQFNLTKAALTGGQ